MAIGSVTPFRPTGTVLITASTTSANIQLTGGGRFGRSNQHGRVGRVRPIWCGPIGNCGQPVGDSRVDRHAGPAEHPCHAGGEQPHHLCRRRTGVRERNGSSDTR